MAIHRARGAGELRRDATTLSLSPGPRRGLFPARPGPARSCRAGAAIGFGHFARPDDSLTVAAQAGTLRRNFQGFTDDPATTLVGLGASAISQFDGLIVQNEKHVGRYRMAALNGDLTGVRGVRRTGIDAAAGAVIERLLCDGTVDAAAIAGEHGLTAEALCHDPLELARLADAGLIDRDGWRIAATPIGVPYLRLAAATFDRFRSVSRGQFSKAV